MIKLILQNTSTTPNTNTPDKHCIAQWINMAVQQSGKHIPASQRSVVVRIVDTKESATLNQQYRHKNGATNILSFPDEHFAGLTADSLGDLAICAELLTQEAQQQHKTIKAHWAHIVIHGTLHLLGYDHIEQEQAAIMEALEIKILTQLQFANPY